MSKLKEDGLTIVDGKINYKGKTCVIDFYAEWCQPCKPQLVVLTELSKEYNDINFYKINVEQHNKNITTHEIQRKREFIKTLFFYFKRSIYMI